MNKQFTHTIGNSQDTGKIETIKVVVFEDELARARHITADVQVQMPFGYRLTDNDYRNIQQAVRSHVFGK